MAQMDTNEEKIILKDEVYSIIGAAMEVHNEMGAGFAEAVYQEAMEMEFGLRGIPFERQKKLKIRYKGVQLQCEYVADLICYGSIIVELKAIRQLTPKEAAQILNYQKATGIRIGLLINFGDPGRLDWERYIY